MNRKPFMSVKCSENKVEKVRQLTHILCLLDFQDITPRELDLLCEFIYNGGVNDKAERAFRASYKTSSANYYTVSKRLYDKGIIVDDVKSVLNSNHIIGKKLHSTFESLKQLYIDNCNGTNMLVIQVP